MDDADLLPKKYSLVRAENGKLYVVAKDDEGEPIEEDPERFPPSVVQDVKAILNTAETDVEAKLAPYLTPQGSGVRVRVPKILD
jgi:hypothetical protein